MRLHPQLLSQMRQWAFSRVRLFRSDLCARRTDLSETSAGGAWDVGWGCLGRRLGVRG